MDARVRRVLDRLEATGFAELDGATLAATVPIRERLLNEVIAEWLPAGHVRELQVHPRAGNRVGVRVRVGTSALLPPVNLTVVIDRQPIFPASPVLVLRLEIGGLLSLAGSALRFLDALPAGIRVERDRVFVDLAKLLEAQGLERWLGHLEDLQINSAEGSLLVSVRAAVRTHESS